MYVGKAPGYPGSTRHIPWASSLADSVNRGWEEEVWNVGHAGHRYVRKASYLQVEDLGYRSEQVRQLRFNYSGLAIPTTTPHTHTQSFTRTAQLLLRAPQLWLWLECIVNNSLSYHIKSILSVKTEPIQTSVSERACPPQCLVLKRSVWQYRQGTDDSGDAVWAVTGRTVSGHDCWCSGWDVAYSWEYLPVYSWMCDNICVLIPGVFTLPAYQRLTARSLLSESQQHKALLSIRYRYSYYSTHSALIINTNGKLYS